MQFLPLDSHLILKYRLKNTSNRYPFSTQTKGSIMFVTLAACARVTISKLLIMKEACVIRNQKISRLAIVSSTFELNFWRRNYFFNFGTFCI